MRRALAACVLVALLAAVGTALGLPAGAGPALGAPSANTVAATNPQAAARVVAGLLDPLRASARDLQSRASARAAGNRRPALNEDEATAIARDSGRLRAWLDDHPAHRTAATLEKNRTWKVSFVGRDGEGEERVEAEVYVNDARGEITEVRTGPQVAWMMARGYEGAFGRAVNRWRIWIPLSAVFLLALIPLTRPRRLVSWRTLDLVALLSFTASWAWFNEGEVFTSVPLQYPPMAYLGLRMVWIVVSRARRARPLPPEPAHLRPSAAAGAPAPGRSGPRRIGLPSWAPTWLLITLLVLTLALRYGLNAFDSNVIDVGYAGVIGADRIVDGQTPYGTFPDDCGRCDTYGPLVYLTYVPFEAVEPWTGRWDDLPAAHGAAVLYDVLTVAGLLALGWSLAGLRLGLGLALAWAAFPFTAFTLSSNSNDTLIAAMITWGLVLARRPLGRGLFLGLAVAAKFGPGLLLPLWTRHPYPRADRTRRAGFRRLLGYVGGLVLATLLTGWVLLLDGLDGVRAFWSRTIGYQMDRDSPFSIWGQFPGLRPVQLVLMAVVLIGALVVLRWPRRLDLVQMSALSAALLIGFEMTLTHWFYLYIPWFLPLVLLAVVPEWPDPERPSPPAPAPAPEEAREPVPSPA
ncbi:MAG: DUF2029 domain-containing protein [Thermoleophilia bacterium]|jgi:hypothetical protein|nr:DUF2029 domain-containing protein [Thermoleophilia bacterium]